MGSGENWDSYDAKQLIDQINGGKGVGASSDVAAGWHELAGVLRQIDDTVRQGLVGAQAEWQGHASATMTSAVSPFGEWANRADEVAAQTTDKVDSLGSFYSTARNSMPTEPLINMGDHHDNVAEKVWQLVPGDHTDQEHAEAAKQAQDQAARDAMKSYDCSTYSDAQRTYFSTPPVLTAASSGPPAPSTPVPSSPTSPPWGRPDDAVPMDRDYRSVGDARVAAQSVDPVAPGAGHFSGSPNAAGTVPAGAGLPGAGQPASGAPGTGQHGSPNVAGTVPSGAGQPGPGQPGAVQPGSALPGPGVGGSGVGGTGVGGTGVGGSGSGHATPEPSRAQRPGTAGTHTGSAAATPGTPGTGIRASNVSPASVEPQSDWSRGSRSPSGMDATTAGGLGMAGGTGRSGAGTSGTGRSGAGTSGTGRSSAGTSGTGRSGAAGGVVRGGGYGDGLSFNGNAPFAGGGGGGGGGGGSGAGEGVGSGTRGGANGAGPNGGGPAGGGARSGGPSAGVGPSEPATNGAGARGGAAGAGSAGRAGAGMGGMGGGGGRGNGDNDSEHETPDYLKQFDHFSDGRVISPPVIGAEPPERR